MRIFKKAAMAATLSLLAGTAFADGYEGVPRTFLWNPGTTEIFDAAEFKKDGPFVIGFSNACLMTLGGSVRK
ncbi:MAG: hypothetical protein OXC60_08730 [Litoreibacter sp.]|nr:hypothetical protein [Litoreibacter sp.]